MQRILHELGKRKLFAPAREALEAPITATELAEVMENLPHAQPPIRMPAQIWPGMPQYANNR